MNGESLYKYVTLPIFSTMLELFCGTAPAVCHHLGINFQLTRAAEKQEERGMEQVRPFCWEFGFK